MGVAVAASGAIEVVGQAPGAQPTLVVVKLGNVVPKAGEILQAPKSMSVSLRLCVLLTSNKESAVATYTRGVLAGGAVVVGLTRSTSWVTEESNGLDCELDKGVSFRFASVLLLGDGFGLTLVAGRGLGVQGLVSGIAAAGAAGAEDVAYDVGALRIADEDNLGVGAATGVVVELTDEGPDALGLRAAAVVTVEGGRVHDVLVAAARLTLADLGYEQVVLTVATGGVSLVGTADGDDMNVVAGRVCLLASLEGRGRGEAGDGEEAGWVHGEGVGLCEVM